MNRDKQMMTEYVQEKALDKGFQASWLDIAFSLMWFEEHYGVNPQASVLTREAITGFFSWMKRDLGYSAKTQLSIATALRDFLRFAYEQGYLGHDLTECIPVIKA